MGHVKDRRELVGRRVRKLSPLCPRRDGATAKGADSYGLCRGLQVPKEEGLLAERGPGRRSVHRVVGPSDALLNPQGQAPASHIPQEVENSVTCSVVTRCETHR